MRTQIITALVGVAGTGLGATLTLIGTTWQARIAARSKRQELDQVKEQARTQLYVDHVGQRRENRRETYIAFMKDVTALVQLTRADRIALALHEGNEAEYLAALSAASGAIEASRNTVMIDGPQVVAKQAADLSQLPYPLAAAVGDAFVMSDVDGRTAALRVAREQREALMRELTRFSVMASAALNLDGVGNHLDDFQSPAQPPAQP